MLSYEIIVHCICGEVLKYNLDANRFTLAVIGREDDTSYQHIPLCGDDNNLLSRTALYFAYDIDKKDWVLGNGFPIAKYHNLDKNNINKLDEETKSLADEYKNLIVKKSTLNQELANKNRSILKINDMFLRNKNNQMRIYLLGCMFNYEG